MSWISKIALIVVALGVCPLGGLSAQEHVTLTLAQRQKVLSLIAEQPTFHDLPTTKRVLCELNAVQRKMPNGRVTEIVTTYHFEYKGGLALRSVVDVTNGKVLEQSRLEAYSPPLAPEERTKSLALAVSKVPAVRALFDRGQEPRTEMMPSVVSYKRDARYGHRLVRLTFLVQGVTPPPSISVTVDLTAESIIGTQSSLSPSHKDQTATIEQSFPIRDGSHPTPETSWRITFGTTFHGAGQILYIKEAYFKSSPSGPWIQVLGDCRLADMFVPYNNGIDRYYDITSIGGILVQLDDNDFGPSCLGSPERYLDDKVGKELHDGHNLWMDHRMSPSKRSRRVEELHLWAVMPAVNYAYPMLYVFRGDGSVGFFAAATAHNLTDKIDDGAVHLHMGCWRLNVVLGDQAMNRIETVRFKSSPALQAKAETVIEPFNGGQEGGIVWNPEELLRLRVTSQFVVNNHNPAHPIAYELVPLRYGNGRTYGVGEDWNHNDIWVTLPTSAAGAPQDRYRELPLYVAHPRSIDAQPGVIWCQSALVHRPRDEDFGQTDSNPAEGVALTTWTGFNLVPRNLFAKTPLYPKP